MMNCCGLSDVTNSQYSGNNDRMPASVSSTYTSSRPGSASAQRTSRGWLRKAARLVLDIGLQPAELDDGDDDRHHEQHDSLRASQAIATELERRAVDQLDDRDCGVVGSTAVGHDVHAFEDLEGQDGVHDHQVQGGRPEEGDGDVA